ncbi:MAG: sigma-70 family RNA polymerase sigma factor [Acidobacteriota bacterium]
MNAANLYPVAAVIADSATPSTADAQRALDLELAQRHRWGDDAAFEELYERFSGLVYNLCLRMAGERELASDLAQEIFLRIFRHLGRFEGRASLKTWVTQVTLNHCRSRLGRRHRRRQRFRPQPLVEEGEEGVELVDEGRDPEQRAAAAEESRQVAAAVAQLPSPYREAVVLCDLEGMSYQQIAEILEVRIGTVRSRIARGRTRLRAILEKSELATGTIGQRPGGGTRSRGEKA